MKHYHCDACRSSKSHKLPFSISIHKSTKPLELIHSDVRGPAPILSHFGFSYYVVFIDDFSKYTWLIPLWKKSDVLSNFIEFRTKAEKQFSTKILSFQSDWGGGGGRFQALTSYLKEHGIHHRISCPYTPEQNGTAERKHRHLIETTLTLLKNASLPEKFWDEAVFTSTFLINRMTTPILQHKSPYEVLFNIKPDYTLLRTFGCLCYPYLRPYSPHKLSARSEQCIFLGYSSFHIGYRCLSLSTNRLYISRNVIFEESIYPYSPTFTPSHNESTGILGSSPTISSNSPSIMISHNHEPSTTVPSTEDPSIIAPSSTTDSNSSDPAPITSSPETTDSDEDSIAQPSSDLPSPSSTPLKTKSLTEIYSQTQPVTRHPLPECLLTNINIHCEPISYSHAIKDSH